RGPDTKPNVVSVLSGMLRSKGITCFVDYQMEYGTHANSDIDAAIRSSRVSIVIISPDFATSGWCLDEVDKIMKKANASGKPKVLPIFYNVEPSTVRHLIADKGYAFDKGPGSTDEEQNRWASALKELSLLRG
ncbi:hypothetical protein KP509_22G048800, partial [Ceratopteris richardii]